MKLTWLAKSLIPVLAGTMMSSAVAAPPFNGTIFLDPDIITAADPTTYQSLSDSGRGQRRMFDRRENNWVEVNAFLFAASFDDGLKIEIQVNPEFGTQEAARNEALKYAPVIGRLPICLRKNVETVWIHRGRKPFGGGSKHLLIHMDQAGDYLASGILEEILVHEAAHTSLDPSHASAPDWRKAQSADGAFLSTYARDNPTREDVAESFLPYFAVRFRPDRISGSLSNTISKTIPNRIAYFDALSLDMYPTAAPEPREGK